MFFACKRTDEEADWRAGAAGFCSFCALSGRKNPLFQTVKGRIKAKSKQDQIKDKQKSDKTQTKRRHRTQTSMPPFLVEATGLEPTTSWSLTKRATKLRYASIKIAVGRNTKEKKKFPQNSINNYIHKSCRCQAFLLFFLKIFSFSLPHCAVSG